MQSQLERWAHMHPTAPRTGRIHEIPASYLLPRIALIMGLAGVCWWANPKLFWTKKPETLDPEFVAEAKRIGNVAQRVNAPPVFLNPFTHRIPGNMSGPEDVKKEF
ncbi:cytochrome c oxidase subunit [Haematococcus lacustris]